MRITQAFVSVVLVGFALFNSFQGLASENLRISPEMEYLGSTHLGNVFSDSDVIEFGQCGTPANPFVHSVQLQVGRAEVEIQEIVLQFGNGQEQRLSVRSYFQPGSISRVIDLAGDERCVKRAFITGRTLGLGMQGVVSLYGVRSRQEAGPHPVPVYQRFLGATYLEFQGDSDVIRLGRCGRNPGDSGLDRASAVRFRVTGNNAEIDHVLVQFGNGHSEEIEVRSYFEQGSWSARKDLIGERRCIQNVYVYGRTVDTRGGGSGEARFEVYALD